MCARGSEPPDESDLPPTPATWIAYVALLPTWSYPAVGPGGCSPQHGCHEGAAGPPGDGSSLGRNLYSSRKLHSFENGTLENRTPRVAVTRRLSLGLMPQPRVASYSPGSMLNVMFSASTL